MIKDMLKLAEKTLEEISLEVLDLEPSKSAMKLHKKTMETLNTITDMKVKEIKENIQPKTVNWDRIWEQFKLQGIRFEHKNFLKDLIEKALKGEE